MGKTVVVAEKPGVGRDIARVLGCTAKGEGCLVNDKYIVTWAVGHLVTLCEPDEIDSKYKQWSNSTLPILPESIPLKVIPATKSQFALVKKIINSKDCDSVICATDAGREGELIFRYIYEKAGCSKPIYRLWISSMTDEAIKEGFRTIQPGSNYEGLYSSAKCRSQADWLVGMNATRAFSLRYGPVLSVGRVQTPTLAILTKRRTEIEKFVPEKYYTVTADFGDYKGTWFDPSSQEKDENTDPAGNSQKKSQTDTRIKDKAKAEEIIKSVEGKEGQVQSFKKQNGSEQPPQLYDLTSLQRDANSMLGFTADKTLKIAQSLYETKKALTYPRTDSRYLPPDMIPRVVQTMNLLPEELLPLVSGAFTGGKLRTTPRTIDASKVTDHHAIIPTANKVNTASFTEDERLIYDMVARRMIAAFYPPCQFLSTKIVTKVDDNSFRTSGRMITDPGWRQVAPLGKNIASSSSKAKKTDADSTDDLPLLTPGEKRKVASASMKDGITKPPAQHNDASLLAAMESAGRESEEEEIRQQMKGSGIGTPATRAAIIERLIQVKYAIRQGKSIVATDKGMQLISIMPEELTSAEMTGRWELALDKITDGKQDAGEFIAGIRRFSAFLVNYAQNKSPKVTFPEESGRKNYPKPDTIPEVVCPVCKKGKIADFPKCFSCTEHGCDCVIWKDCLTRGGGPELNAKIMKLLLTSSQVRGSTGTIILNNGNIEFHPVGSNAPSAVRPIIWKKKQGR